MPATDSTEPSEKAAELAHVSSHENASVRQNVEALYDEQAELRGELESIRRHGVSPDGRVALVRTVRVSIAIGVLALVYLLGRSSV